VTDLPRVERRRSPISGWGVYAAEPIKEDTRVVEYKGQLVPQAEAWRREQRYLPRHRIWIFVINSRWARDAAFGGNVARYINHACRPNCYVDIEGRHIWIRASRDIRTGEELTYDYNTDGVAGIACRCRRGCTRII
jgi:SET domain-containing protein